MLFCLLCTHIFRVNVPLSSFLKSYMNNCIFFNNYNRCYNVQFTKAALLSRIIMLFLLWVNITVFDSGFGGFFQILLQYLHKTNIRVRIRATACMALSSATLYESSAFLNTVVLSYFIKKKHNPVPPSPLTTGPH
jgi:hypothetical protein